MAESLDKSVGKARVGDQGDVEVDSGATDDIPVVKFEGCEVTGDIDHQMNLFTVKEVKGLGTVRLGGPIHKGGGDMVFVEETVCAGSGKEVVSLVGEELSGVEERGFLSGGTGGEEDILPGYLVAHGEHGGEDGLGKVFAEAGHFPSGGHVDAQYGVGLLEAAEGKLGGFDANVVEVKFGFGRFFDGEAEHNTGGYFDEVYL